MINCSKFISKHIKFVFLFLFYFFTINIFFLYSSDSKRIRIEELGIKIGILEKGKYNSITDVNGVMVGHSTIIKSKNIRTGVTSILPHENNIFQNKVPAAIYIGNGYGKLTGFTQVKELGNIETPIVLTNTLSVPTASDALIDFTLNQKDNKNINSVNPIVGETNDGWLNDIKRRAVKKSHVFNSIKNASSRMIEEGSIGAGTGTTCFGFKGGIGTSSRILPPELGGYTVGVLVQTNFGGILRIDGIPVGIELNKYYLSKKNNNTPDGSCMIVIATNAPIDSRNLYRLAKRALFGLARTGGISSNGSGDYVIAFSTSKNLRIAHRSKSPIIIKKLLKNNMMSPLFLAVIEATEEAILNSMFKASSMNGQKGRFVRAIPINKVKKILKKYNKIK